MRNVPAGFIAAIRDNTVHSGELYEFTLRNGYSYYYTSHGEDIDWGTPSIRYYAAPIIRTSIESSINLEVDSVELRLINITSELFDIVNSNWLDGVYVKIKRILWDQNSASGMEFVIFAGTGSITSLDRREVVLTCTSILNSLNVIVPKNIYQQPCNHSLFSTNCGLVKSIQSSVATSDAQNDYTIIDSTFVPPVGDITKYNNGEISITSGDSIGEHRSIVLTSPGLFVVSVPFPKKILVGVTFDYSPGCDFTPETCRDRYNNLANFLGFVYLPPPEQGM